MQKVTNSNNIISISEMFRMQPPLMGNLGNIDENEIRHLKPKLYEKERQYLTITTIFLSSITPLASMRVKYLGECNII